MSKENQIAIIKSVAGEFGSALKTKMAELRLEIDQNLNIRDTEFRVDVDGLKQQLSLVAEKLVDIENSFEQSLIKTISDIDGKFEIKDTQFLDFCEKQNKELMQPHIQAIEQIEKSVCDLVEEISVANELKKGIDSIVVDFEQLNCSLKDLESSIQSNKASNTDELNLINEKIESVKGRFACLDEIKSDFESQLNGFEKSFDVSFKKIEEYLEFLAKQLTEVREIKPDPSDMFFQIKEIPEFQSCFDQRIDERVQVISDFQNELKQSFEKDCFELRQQIKLLSETDNEFDVLKFLESKEFVDSVIAIFTFRFEEAWNKNFDAFLSEKEAIEKTIKDSVLGINNDLKDRVCKQDLKIQIRKIESDLKSSFDKKLKSVEISSEESMTKKFQEKIDHLSWSIDSVDRNWQSGLNQLAYKFKPENVLKECIKSNDFSRYVSGISKQISEVFENQIRVDIQTEIEVAKVEVKEKLDAYSNLIKALETKIKDNANLEIEIDVEKLVDDLRLNEHFTKYIDSYLNTVKKKIEHEIIENIEKQSHEFYTKSMIAVEEMVKSYLESLPKPKDGKDGKNGIAGLGFDTKQYVKGEIYLKGEEVQANIGQCFKALKNTNGVPSVSEDWERVGNSGLRWIKHKPISPAQMIVQRGKNGVDGKDGKDGECGKDAATLVEIQCEDEALVFVMSDGHVFEVENKMLQSVKQLAKPPEPPDDDAIEMKWFRGVWSENKAYGKGDVVKNGKSLYLAAKVPIKGVMSSPHWIPLLEAE